MKGSVTEVIYDFVFTPPRAQIGFQSSVIPDTGTHLRTALFVFELGKSTYVTILLFIIQIKLTSIHPQPDPFA